MYVVFITNTRFKHKVFYCDKEESFILGLLTGRCRPSANHNLQTTNVGLNLPFLHYELYSKVTVTKTLVLSIY